MDLFVDAEDACCEFSFFGWFHDRYEVDGSWDLRKEDEVVDLVTKFSRKGKKSRSHLWRELGWALVSW